MHGIFPQSEKTGKTEVQLNVETEEILFIDGSIKFNNNSLFIFDV